MARSLAERLRAHEQQKARLAEQEAKLKADERKARTRQLIHAGGLIDKVGLLALDPNILYGALLSLRDGAADPEQVRQWTALGGRTFAARPVLPRKTRKRSGSPSPLLSAATRQPRCAAAASALTSFCSTGKGSPISTRPKRLPRHTAGRYAGKCPCHIQETRRHARALTWLACAVKAGLAEQDTGRHPRASSPSPPRRRPHPPPIPPAGYQAFSEAKAEV